VVALPAGLAVTTLKVLQFLHLSPLYPWIYATASKDSFVSIDHLTQRLGYTPRYSNESALCRNYDWYVEHRSEFSGRTGTTHTLPWNHGALALARLLF
jgi:hypothetical protein